MLRRALLEASRSRALRQFATSAPVTRDVVARFVAGESLPEVLAVVRRLVDDGLQVSVDHLGEDTRERSQADAATSAYLDLFDALRTSRLAERVEASVKLSALGQSLGETGEALALDNAQVICGAASSLGTTVTLDMEDHTTTDSTLRVLAELRTDFPGTGAVLQSQLRRTEADCRALATPGSRVRLCKGAYAEPEEVAFPTPAEVDLAYVRCLKVLMAGDGYPMVATHDPRLVEIALKLAADTGRGPGDFEFQMLYGVRPVEQRRLVGLGHTVRVYLPYGTDWYGYLVRRLAERPANLTFFARSLATRG